MSGLRIFVLGEIVPGVSEIQWRMSPLPVVEQAPVDGTLQDTIDIANADLLAEEWEEYWLDQEREFPR